MLKNILKIGEGVWNAPSLACTFFFFKHKAKFKSFRFRIGILELVITLLIFNSTKNAINPYSVTQVIKIVRKLNVTDFFFFLIASFYIYYSNWPFLAAAGALLPHHFGRLEILIGSLRFQTAALSSPQANTISVWSQKSFEGGEKSFRCMEHFIKSQLF